MTKRIVRLVVVLDASDPAKDPQLDALIRSFGSYMLDHGFPNAIHAECLVREDEAKDLNVN